MPVEGDLLLYKLAGAEGLRVFVNIECVTIPCSKELILEVEW